MTGAAWAGSVTSGALSSAPSGTGSLPADAPMLDVEDTVTAGAGKLVRLLRLSVVADAWVERLVSNPPAWGLATGMGSPAADRASALAPEKDCSAASGAPCLCWVMPA